MKYLKITTSIIGCFIMWFGILAVVSTISFHQYDSIPTLSWIAVFGLVLWRAPKENGILTKSLKKLYRSKESKRNYKMIRLLTILVNTLGVVFFVFLMATWDGYNQDVIITVSVFSIFICIFSLYTIIAGDDDELSLIKLYVKRKKLEEQAKIDSLDSNS